MTVPTVSSGTYLPATIVLSTHTATTAGLSAIASTLTSAASSSAQTKGLSSRIRAWLSTLMDALLKYPAKLPFIGRFFAKKETVPTTTVAPATTPMTTVAPTLTSRVPDAELAALIYAQFPSVYALPANEADTAMAGFVASPLVVDQTLELFRQIVSPAVQMQAFQAVLAAVNSTDDIARQFYRAFTPDVQRQFRAQIWLINGGDNGRADFGEHMIATAIRGPLVQQAAAALQGVLAAGSTTRAATRV